MPSQGAIANSRQLQRRYRLYFRPFFRHVPDEYVLRHDANKTLLRIEDPLNADRRLFVKIYHYKNITFRWRMFCGALGARHDMKITQALGRRGFFAPDAVAAISSPLGCFAMQSLFVCSWLDDYLPLGRFLKKLHSGSPDFDAAISKVGRYVALLHNAGFLIKDLNPGNLLINTGIGDEKFCLVDYESVRLVNSVPSQARVKNLVQLATSLLSISSFSTDILCEAYGAACEDALPDGLTEDVLYRAQRLLGLYKSLEDGYFRDISERLSGGGDQ